MPEVSIIVPIYNVEKYLKRCIESVLNQTFKDFELILVDDGSPDNCPSICDEYAQKDNRIKVIHKENGGVSSARNAGLNVAQGKYIMFIDGDDYYNFDSVDIMIKIISQNNEDIIAFNYVTVTENDTVLWNRGYNEKIYRFDPENEWLDFITIKVLSNEIGWEIYNKIFKKDVIEKENIRFNEKYKIGEDLMFFLQYLINIKSFKTINYDGYFYLSRDGSAMKTNTESKINDFVNMNFDLYNRIKGKKLKYITRNYYLLFYMSMNIRYMQAGFAKSLEDIKNIEKKHFFRKNTFKIISHSKEVFEHQNRDTQKGVLIENLYYYAYASNQVIKKILLKILRK